jgi:hypothetical protein
MAISRKPDGSTDKIYAQGEGHGFRVIDFDTHVVSSLIKLPDIAPALQNRGGSHGIGITSDQKTLRNSGKNSAVYEFAAGLVKSGMWLDYGTSLCQPDAFDRALGARVRELTNAKIRHCLTMRPRAVLEADPASDGAAAATRYCAARRAMEPVIMMRR